MSLDQLDWWLAVGNPQCFGHYDVWTTYVEMFGIFPETENCFRTWIIAKLYYLPHSALVCDFLHELIPSMTIYKHGKNSRLVFGYLVRVNVYIHMLTGLPWWASIALATILLRSCITLPLAIYSSYIRTQVENLQPEIWKLSQRLKIETAKTIREFGWDMEHGRQRYNYSIKKVIRELYIQENCHPGKSTVLILVQLPQWMALSFIFRYTTGFAPIMDIKSSNKLIWRIAMYIWYISQRLLMSIYVGNCKSAS